MRNCPRCREAFDVGTYRDLGDGILRLVCLRCAHWCDTITVRCYNAVDRAVRGYRGKAA